MGNLIADIRKCQLQTGKAGQPSGPSAVPVGPGEAETGGGGTSAAGAASGVAVGGGTVVPTTPPATPSGVPLGAPPAVLGLLTVTQQMVKDQMTRGADTVQFAARQLGVHYLKRYFLLICYRCVCLLALALDSGRLLLGCCLVPADSLHAKSEVLFTNC